MRAASILKAFSSMTEILELRTITKRTQQTKATAFRLSETLVEAGLMERVGHQGLPSARQPFSGPAMEDWLCCAKQRGGIYSHGDRQPGGCGQRSQYRPGGAE